MARDFRKSGVLLPTGVPASARHAAPKDYVDAHTHPGDTTTLMAARIRRATGTSSAASGGRVLTDVMDTTVRNDGMTVDLGTSKITVPVTGWYAVQLKLRLNVTSSQSSLATIYVNGAESVRGHQIAAVAQADLIAFAVLYLTSGDYIQPGGFTSISTGFDGHATTDYCSMSVAFLSAPMINGLLDHKATHYSGGADPLTPANIGAQPVDSDLTTIAGLTATTDNFMVAASSAWASRTPSQAKTALGLVKADVGLSNVDNTADTAKPVSTAQQTALDGKQNLDTELTLLAGLAETTDNVIQSVASAWASRTPAELAATMPADQAAGTASLRTLGTGATQAAVGSHAHSGVGLLLKDWPALAGIPRTTAFPGIVQANGTNLPVPGYAFDAAAIEYIYYANWAARPYSAGSLVVDLDWYADTASTNVVMWSVALAAITPTTDSQDAETKAFAAQTTGTTTHLGTTGQRVHRTSITISGASLDSLAAGDRCCLRVGREATNGSDTMAGDAILVGVTIRE